MLSVILPVYNGERYLAEAIQSVLAQTTPVDELVVVDDGSTDGSAAIVQAFVATSVASTSPRVVYHHQPNANTGAARNTGIRLAKGDLLAFIDADDHWSPDKVERQLAALNSDPEAEAVFGHAQQFVSPALDDEARAPAES